MIVAENIRRKLYDLAGIGTVNFNACAEVPTHILDVSADIFGYTFIQPGGEQDLTKDIARTARVIFAEGENLRRVAESFCPATKCVSAPFGYVPSLGDIFSSGPPVVGLLNHDWATHLDAKHAEKRLLNKLKVERFLVFGQHGPLDLEQEIVEDFNTFAKAIDILLLPARPVSVLNGLTLPISAMHARTIILATNTSCYYELSPAPGVFYLQDQPQLWNRAIHTFTADRSGLDNLVQGNHRWTIQKCKETVKRVKRAMERYQLLVAA